MATTIYVLNRYYTQDNTYKLVAASSAITEIKEFLENSYNTCAKARDPVPDYQLVACNMEKGEVEWVNMKIMPFHQTTVELVVPPQAA